jgi:hypothetical protein
MSSSTAAPGFQSPWFLIVPPDSEAWLPTEQVVALYRQRMQIEHCFRDRKSHWACVACACGWTSHSACSAC